MQFTVPILFIVFNRADTGIQVLNQLRVVQPAKIYFAADAPRSEKGDSEKIACDKARQIIELIDWPCEIKTYFPAENVGARQFIGDAISWMFESENEGIILEHDCLPHIDFFEYCKVLLEWYRDEDRVMHISGTQFQDRGRSNPELQFSHYNHIWGWATWKRAWQHYDLEMRPLDLFIQHKSIQNVFPNKAEQHYWVKKLLQAQTGEIKSWDFQWTFAIWNKEGVAVIPGSNLVSNIGFGAGAIHTKDKSHFLSNRPTYPFPINQISRPSEIKINRDSEVYDFKQVFYPPLFQRIKNKIKLIWASF